MKQLTVRLKDEELTRALEDRAHETGRSLNGVVVELLRGALGLPRTQRNTIGDALDRFCGDMPEEEAQEVLRTIEDLEKIDDELWSS